MQTRTGPRAPGEHMRRSRRRWQPIPQNTTVVGIDVAKRKSVAVAQLREGFTARPLSFTNDSDGFEAFWSYCQKAVKEGDFEGFVVALEPTGHYGDPLLEWLGSRQVELYLVQPLHTKRAKELYDGTWRKTDAKDAELIADLCRQGKSKPHRPLTGVFLELRLLGREREQLVKRRTQVLNRLHRHIDVVFPELTQHFADLASSGFLWWLETAPTPAETLGLRRRRLVTGLKKATRGMLREDRVDAIRGSAKTSIGVTAGAETHGTVIRATVWELRVLEQRLDSIEAEMTSRLDQVDYATRLLSIPRLGAVTLAILLGELGDLRRFRHSKQLLSMAGLDLVEVRSGETPKNEPQRIISRRGRRYLRQILYLAALRLGWNILAEPRRRIVEDRNKPPMKAAVANMSRILRVLHALVRDETEFDPTRWEPATS